jgi:oxygen-independent coproporphyrinogen-3 oxidase
VPFCSEICPYCDFAVAKASAARRERFPELLLAEMGLAAAGASPPAPRAEEPWRAADTVYLGGGTPSILSLPALAAILDGARELLGCHVQAWVFLEANPEDVTAESAAGWRHLGARTLSLGIQSFDAGELAFLGRRHSPQEGRRAVEVAREAGFHTVSLDLIYGLPGQGLAAWRRNLEEAVAIAPDHLSCYELTVHEGTPFGRRRARGLLPELPLGDRADLFAFTHAFLADAGYLGYEVSNFARDLEHRSRHNEKYWDHTPYLGLGPGAHSFDGRRRRWNERKLDPYRRRLLAGELPIAGEEVLSREQLALEALMLRLRTAEGIDLAHFRERYGVDLLAVNSALVERLAREGLLAVEAGRLAPSLSGLAVADALAASFDLEGTPSSDPGSIAD